MATANRDERSGIRAGAARTGPLLVAVVVGSFAVAALVAFAHLDPQAGSAVIPRLESGPAERSQLAPVPRARSRPHAANREVAPAAQSIVSSASAPATAAIPRRAAPVPRATPTPRPRVPRPVTVVVAGPVAAPGTAGRVRTPEATARPKPRPAPRRSATPTPDPVPAPAPAPAPAASSSTPPADEPAPIAQVPTTTAAPDEAVKPALVNTN